MKLITNLINYPIELMITFFFVVMVVSALLLFNIPIWFLIFPLVFVVIRVVWVEKATLYCDKLMQEIEKIGRVAIESVPLGATLTINNFTEYLPPYWKAHPFKLFLNIKRWDYISLLGHNSPGYPSFVKTALCSMEYRKYLANINKTSYIKCVFNMIKNILKDANISLGD